ncbi:MAG: AAA family ATPase [Promethearchaeota archaeon]
MIIISKKSENISSKQNKSIQEKRISYTDDIIRDRLGNYGAVYFPEDIKESVDDIIGCDVQKERLEDFFKALKKYEEFKDQLKRAKLTPNLTVLLYGPPGTGKTTLTRAFSKKYGIPICIVEADRLVSSLLGDTIKNIRKVIELASDIADERGAFILFFDEIDAIGSERSSVHEVGEIKRAVISFLQHIDKVNYEGHPLAIIGATNHQHQLDSAIWRRFTFHLSFDFPDYKLRKGIIESFLRKIENAKIGIDSNIYTFLETEAKKIQEIEFKLESKLGRKISEFDDDIFWNEIKKNNLISGLLKLTHGYSGSDIERGMRVALFKGIQTEYITYDTLFHSLELVGGTAVHLEGYNQKNASTKLNKISSKERKSIPPEI